MSGIFCIAYTESDYHQTEADNNSVYQQYGFGETDVKELLQHHSDNVSSPCSSLIAHHDTATDADKSSSHNTGQHQVIGHVQSAAEKLGGV